MLKLGKLTDYATVIMTVLAADPEPVLPAQELARRTHVAEPTVSKVLKLLARAGLVEALRGVRGGYRLARPPERISMAEVIHAMDGPVALTECATHQSCCGIEPYCVVRGNWRLISGRIRETLESVSLAQMAAPMGRSAPGVGAAALPVTFHKAAASVARRNG